MSSVPRCAADHEMVVSTYDSGGYIGGWVCDLCRRDGATTEPRWFCRDCSSDYCFTCHPNVGDGEAGAGAGGKVVEAKKFEDGLLRWRRPADSSVVTKEMGLRVLQSLISSLSTHGASLPPKLSAKMLDRMVGLLSRVKPAALFQDWSPPSGAESPVALTPADIVVDSSSASSTGASNMLTDSGSSWKSRSQAKISRVTATLTKPVVLSSISFTVAEACAPESMKILIREGDGGDDDPFVEVGELYAKDLNRPRRVVLEGAGSPPVSAVRLVFTGHSKSNKDRAHGLTFLGLNQVAAGVSVDPAVTIDSLHTWLRSLGSENPELRPKVLEALQSLSLSSASFAALLSTVEVLLSYGADPLPSSVLDSNDKFLSDVEEQFEPVCHVVHSLAGGSGGSGSGHGVDAIFDEVSGGVSVTEGGKKVKSTGSNEHALVNISFKKGKAVWEFKLEEDSHGQECVCFGLGIKPVSRSNYDSSRELWMYRAYNGQIYSRGSSAGPRMAKIHPGDIVRFELNMDIGEARAFVNGADQGAIFKNLEGLEVYPAVCFYSSGRAISLVKVEVPEAGRSTFLSQMQESLDGSSIHGSLGKGRCLPTSGDRLMAVNGTAAKNGLCTMVPADGSAVVAYNIEADKGFDCFDAVVGLNDPPTSEEKDAEEEKESKTAEDNRTITYEVLCDGESKFVATDTVPPGANPSMAGHPILLNIKGVQRLELKVSCSGSPSKLFPVWLNPRIRKAPWAFDKVAHDENVAATLGGAGFDATKSGSRVRRLLDTVRLFSRQALKAMRTSPPPLTLGDETLPLEVPFCIQVQDGTFQSLARVLRTAVTQLKATPADPTFTEIVLSLLTTAKANLRRLIASGVAARHAGVSLPGVGADGKPDAASEESKTDPAERESKTASDPDTTGLGTLHSILSELSGKPGEPTPANVPLPVCVEASNVVDMGLPLFYPTEASRKELLDSLVSRGGVVEVNFLWPPPPTTDAAGAGAGAGDDKDASETEDFRFERAVLLLQCYAAQKGWKHAVHGQFKRSIHLVVSLDPSSSITEFLTTSMDSLLTQAGFPKWSFPGGCDNPSINFTVERYLEFDRKQRLDAEPGCGWVRLYPEGVATLDQVTERVQGYIKELAEEVAAEEELAKQREAALEKKRAEEAAAAAAAPPEAPPAPVEVSDDGGAGRLFDDDSDDTESSYDSEY